MFNKSVQGLEPVKKGKKWGDGFHENIFNPEIMATQTASLDTHRSWGCPVVLHVDGEDFVIDRITKCDGYGDECRRIKFAGFALF